MNITIKTKNFTLTSEISNYIDKRAGALNKFISTDDTTAYCEVEVGQQSKHHQRGNVHYAEFNVQVGGQLFRATAEEETIQTAIDSAQKNVLRELRRNKRKQAHLFRRGSAKLKDITQGLSVRGARIKGYVIRNSKKKR
jgi:ribosomal subunit interface protein